MAQPGTIEAAMSPFPYSIEADAHVGTAWTLLHQLRFHHLPVRDGERIVGVISVRDLKHAQTLGRDISPASELRVAELCVHDVAIVEPDTPLVDVLLRMANEHRDVVLVARQGHLIGVFTFSDACRGYAEMLQREHNRPPRR
jgi:acetoin utilization protein AcuB